MRTGWPAAVLGAVAGLVVLGATTAAWVTRREVGDIGGVAVEQVTTVSGAEVQPALMLVGLVLVLAAVAVAFVAGRPRRVLGAVAATAGLVGVVLAVLGAVEASTRDGALQPAAWWAVAGSVLGVAAGAVALRRPERRAALPARFDLDARPGDGAGEPVDEWNLAAEPGTEDEGPH